MTKRGRLLKDNGADLFERLPDLVDQLNEWLADVSHDGVRPVASMTYSDEYVKVQIGETPVWDTAGEYAEVPTLAACLSHWNRELRTMLPFLDKAHVRLHISPEKEQDGKVPA